MLQVHVAIRIEDRGRHHVEILGHARTLEVDDAHATVVDDPAPRLDHADTQVEVVAVHEEDLVEHATVGSDGFQCGSRCEHECTVDRAHVIRAVIRQVRQVIARKEPDPGKRRRQPAGPTKARPQRRDGTPAGEVHGAVCLDQLGRDQSDVRFGLEPPDAMRKRRQVADRIGIEEEHVGPVGAAVTKIVRATEAQVGTGIDIGDVREITPDDFPRPVARRIVDHNRLHHTAVDMMRDRSQARGDLVARLVRDNDHGKQRQLLHRQIESLSDAWPERNVRPRAASQRHRGLQKPRPLTADGPCERARTARRQR